MQGSEIFSKAGDEDLSDGLIGELDIVEFEIFSKVNHVVGEDLNRQFAATHSTEGRFGVVFRKEVVVRAEAAAERPNESETVAIEIVTVAHGCMDDVSLKAEHHFRIEIGVFMASAVVIGAFFHKGVARRVKERVPSRA